MVRLMGFLKHTRNLNQSKEKGKKSRGMIAEVAIKKREYKGPRKPPTPHSPHPDVIEDVEATRM